MKKLSIIIGICLIVTLFAAWDAAQVNAENEIHVAFMVNKLSSAFWTDVEKGAKEAAEALGWKIDILSPITPDSNEQQIQLLEQALINPPDIFIITPADARGITPAIEKINEAGIPIINYNARFLDPDVESLTFVGLDKYELAKIVAEDLVEKLGGFDARGCYRFPDLH